jgi:hypothetical protein
LAIEVVKLLVKLLMKLYQTGPKLEKLLVNDTDTRYKMAQLVGYDGK